MSFSFFRSLKRLEITILPHSMIVTIYLSHLSYCYHLHLVWKRLSFNVNFFLSDNLSNSVNTWCHGFLMSYYGHSPIFKHFKVRKLLQKKIPLKRIFHATPCAFMTTECQFSMDLLHTYLVLALALDYFYNCFYSIQPWI